MRRLRRTIIGLAALAALGLLGPGSALASSMSVSSGALTYTGASTEANHVTFWFDATYGVYVIQDTGVTSISVSGKGCQSYTAQIAYCEFGKVTSVNARVGNAGGFAQNNLTLTPVTLTAGAGNDTLIGGGGLNTLVAAGGNDTLTAGSGNTRLVGGSGTTTMTGGSGTNIYAGGSGADTINARNGVAENVTCAAGADSVSADSGDTTSADCESVDRGTSSTPAGEAGGTGGAGLAPGLGDELAPFTAPVAAISSAPVVLTNANAVPIQVGCPATVAGGCEGTISVALVEDGGAVSKARRVKRRPISKSKRFRIKAGRKAVVPVSLSRRGGRAVRKGLRKNRSLKLAVTIAMRSEAGTHTTTKTITVKSARRSGANKPKPGKKRRR